MKINQMNVGQIVVALRKAATSGDTGSKYVQALRHRLALLRRRRQK